MAWKSGQSYSTDLRSRVLAAIDGGSPAKAMAQLFQVSVSYIYKALGRREADRRDRGAAAAQPADAQAGGPSRRDRGRGGAPAGRHAGGAARLAAGDARRVTASLGLMHKTLARLGLTLKKSRGGPRSRTGPTSPSSAPTGAPSKAR